MKSVEVLYDRELTKPPEDEVKSGINILNGILNGVLIEQKTRRISLPIRPEEDFYVCDSFGEIKSKQADYSLIVTDVPLASMHKSDVLSSLFRDEDSYKLSLKLFGPAGIADINSGSAIVSRYHSRAIRYTVAHELAHLLGMKRKDSIFHDNESPGHCIDSRCILYHQSNQRDFPVFRNHTSFSNGFRRKKKAPPEQPRESFCNDCTKQLKGISQAL